MTEMFSIPENQTYQLRYNHQNLYLPKPKINFLKQNFSYRGAVLWNRVLTGKFPSTKIPETFIRSFKKLIKDLCNLIGDLNGEITIHLFIRLRILHRLGCVIIFKSFISVVFTLDFCKYPRPFQKQIYERLPC